MKHRWLCGVLFAGLCVVQSSWAEEAAQPRVIYLQPLGREVAKLDSDLVVTALHAVYGIEVRMLPPVALPKEAYYPPRGRYRAEKLNEFLRPLLPADGAYILGITGVDISTTKDDVYDWGMVGLAGNIGRGEKAAVFSLFRCKKKGDSQLLARQRFAKTAVHELGHVLGLPHCETYGCLMEDANGKIATADRENDLCQRCRQQLKDAGVVLPATPTLPWPRPEQK